MYVSRICEPSLCFYEIYVVLFGFSLLFHFICSLLRLDVNNIMLSLPTQQASICYDSRFSHRDLPKWHIRKYKGVKHLSFYNLLSVFSLRLDDKFDHRAKSTIACSLHTFPPSFTFLIKQAFFTLPIYSYQNTQS